MPTTPTTRRGGARSRQGGVPTVLPPAVPAGGVADVRHPVPDRPPRQLSLSLGEPEPEPARVPREVLAGVVHVPGWLDLDAQRALVERFREWAQPPAGLRHPRVPTGHLMSVQSVCLGWHWYPYVYSRTADDTDGAPVKPMPPSLRDLGRRAVVATAIGGLAHPAAAAYDPDAAILNLYTPDARLGLHQDGEEPSDAPVVTLSIGDACTFRLAGIDRRTGPFVDVELRSGDLLVFGGPSRRIHHGVPRILSGTAPDGLGLPAGRLSITLRQTGLTDR